MTHAAVDTDYLYLSARVRAMERRLLSRAQAERMLEAPTAEAAAGVLQECGYEELPRLNERSLEDVLAARRREIFCALYRVSPERRIIDVFRAPYDYQNVKALLKAEAAGADPAPLLTDAGRVCPAELREAMRSADLRGLPPPLQRAAAAGRDALRAGGPQAADFALDRSCFAELGSLARESGSAFLAGLIRLRIDSANLRAAVRALRRGMGVERLKDALLPGGGVAGGRLLQAAAGGGLEEACAASPLKEAAAAAGAALRGGRLARFEKLCDDAVLRYAAGGRYTAFGEAPVIGYLTAAENELTVVRLLLRGRMAGLGADAIRERLRAPYG